MSQITYRTAQGEVVATGELGKDVVQMEGNYYFNPAKVNLEYFERKKNAYHCPIKNSDCDYFYVKNGDEISENEVAWVYETITNSLYKNIEGKIGFYPRSSEMLFLGVG